METDLFLWFTDCFHVELFTLTILNSVLPIWVRKCWLRKLKLMKLCKIFAKSSDSFLSLLILGSLQIFLVWCRCLISWLDLFLGINVVKQMEIFRILAGILHLGNVELKEDENSSESTIIPVRENNVITLSFV